MSDTVYTVETFEDPDTGDLAIELPQEVLDHLGIEFGDELKWKVYEDGTILLTKDDSVLLKKEA